MNKCLMLLSLFFLCQFFSGCYDENSSYGENFVTSVFRNVYTDSSTVMVSSSLIDSLETNNQNVVLLGNYKHTLWGGISSTAYVPFSSPSYYTDIEETVVMDSLVLLLRYNGYALGDTNQYQTYAIHYLEEKVTLNDNGYLYNSSSFQYQSAPVAQCTFRPRSGENSDIEIRLPDNFGKDLLNKLHNRDLSISSERFEDYFKGLAIVPQKENCNALLSFAVGDTALSLILRYHVIGDSENAQECIINPNSSNTFYHIDHDRSGTSLEGYAEKSIEVEADEIGNRGLVFGGLGWFTRLKFPYINNILHEGKRISIESATLQISPELNTYNEYNTLPDSLYLYITDENNVVLEAVNDYLGEEVQVGSLVKDETFPENTYYSFDITDFIQQELGAFDKYKHNLQLVFMEDDYIKTFKNLTINAKNGKNPVKLKLIYKIYESN